MGRILMALAIRVRRMPAVWASVLSIGLVACEAGEAPFRQVQFCLTEQDGPREFKQTMQAIAAEENLQFGDRSKQAEAELRSLPNVPDSIRRSFPLILISARNEHYGFGAGNASLGTDQVSVGFGGPETPIARAFADRTVSRLQQSWDVLAVPEHRGALPLDCSA